jgi:hypothetical protein
VLSPRFDEAAPAQTGEMVRDLRLRLTEPLDQRADRELALVAQKLEDPHPGRVAQSAEVLGNQIAAGRRVG